MVEVEIPESLSDCSFAREHFTHIVEWAKQNHPFYQQWLLNDNKEVPILTRNDVLNNNQLLLNGYPVTGKTSGSTGIPVQVSWSVQRSVLEQRVTDKFISWLGGTLPGTRIIHLTAKHTGDEYLDINCSVTVQIEKILQRYHNYGAVSLTTYPTNAERLCHTVLDQGLDMSFIQRFGCYAEVLENYQEEMIREAFPNAAVWVTYSANEIGLIAGRCPFEPEYYHIFTGKLGVEVLNDEGNSCETGELGRLVITDYFNTRTPFIRYEIGDLAAKGDCPCGKISLPALSRVAGKVRGALLHRNGERVPFTKLSESLFNITEIQQYQVIQHKLDVFELRYVVASYKHGESAFFASVRSVFAEHFGYFPIVRFNREMSIEREKNGKFYASISYV